MIAAGIAPVLIIPARNTEGSAEVVLPVPMYTRFGTVRYCGTIDCVDRATELSPVAVTPDTVLTAVMAVGAIVKSVRAAPVGATVNSVLAIIDMDLAEIDVADVNALTADPANVLLLSSKLFTAAVPALLKYAPAAVPALLIPVTAVVLIPESAAKVVCPVVVTLESVVLFVMLPSWPRSAIVHVLAAWEKSIRFPTTYSPAEVLVIANVIG